MFKNSIFIVVLVLWGSSIFAGEARRRLLASLYRVPEVPSVSHSPRKVLHMPTHSHQQAPLCVQRCVHPFVDFRQLSDEEIKKHSERVLACIMFVCSFEALSYVPKL